MTKRQGIFVFLSVVVIGLFAVGIWHYLNQCHGVDACAAAAAESHERDEPSEPQ
jgi:hypothetical protein